MKSTIFSLLPIVGFAVAATESVCTQSTTTKTEIETVYETASVPKNTAVLSSTASVCIPATVTETKHEKVYVTVTPGKVAAETAGSDTTTTTTSTLNLYTTVTVRPSGGFYGNSSAPAIFKSTKTTDIGYPAKTPDSASTDKTPDSDSTGEDDEEEDDDSDSCDADDLPTPGSMSSATPSPTPVPYGKAPEAPKAPEAAKASPAAAPAAPAAAPAAPAAAAASPANVRAAAATSNSGKATFYGGNTSGGACSFSGFTIPSGLFGTALTDSDWNNSGNCGACVSVTGPAGNKITAMVVDECSGCGPHHLDLFPDAFAKLAEPSKGVIDVKWEVVPCGITAPFTLRNKSGTSKFWFSMQVVGSNVPVKSLEVSTDGGSTWKSTVRKTYNYFENPAGFGTDSVDVKVTSTSGQSIIVKGVGIASGTTKTAGSNFSS